MYLKLNCEIDSLKINAISFMFSNKMIFAILKNLLKYN